MRKNGKSNFRLPELRCDQFFVLDDPSLYHEGLGLRWEQTEYLGPDQVNIDVGGGAGGAAWRFRVRWDLVLSFVLRLGTAPRPPGLWVGSGCIRLR